MPPPRLRVRAMLAYLVLAHLLFAGLLVLALWQRPIWILGAEPLLLLSLAGGLALLRRAAATQELLGTAVELLRERDFGSHLLPVGQPETDALVDLFNRMSDQLRAERLRLEEQSFLLDKVLSASPVGVLTLDHDGRVTLRNEAAAQLLGAGSEGKGDRIVGTPLAAVPGALARELAGLAAGESRLVPLEGRRRLKCYRGQFFDRGFPRSFYLIEEVTEELRTSEKAAYEQLVRMISHEVGNSVAAVASLLESCLAFGERLPATEREDFRQALTVAGARMRSLNAFVNGFAEVVRLPPPSAGPPTSRRWSPRYGCCSLRSSSGGASPAAGPGARGCRRCPSTATRSSRCSSTSSATPSRRSARTARSRCRWLARRVR